MVKLLDKAKLAKAGSVRVRGSFAERQAKNREFRSKHKLTYSGPSSDAPASSTVLRSFEQKSFLVFAAMTEKAAKEFLYQKGVLPKAIRSDRACGIHCWGCQGELTRTGEEWRCTAPTSRCSIRARLRNPQVAFTPWYGHNRSGCAPDYGMFLRTAFCLGVRMSNDQACHMCHVPEDSVRAGYEKTLRLFQSHKIALAFKEVQFAQAVVFKDEVVETDTARTAGRMESGSRKHTGRTLVLKGRKTKQWTAVALRPSSSSGRRGCPPETACEVRKPLRRSLGPGVVLAADGARAWAKAVPEKPRLEGVSHGRRVFTPTAKLSKSALDSRTTRMLQRNSTGKAGRGKLAAESARLFKVPAGDHAAEGVLGNLKTTLRRIGGAGKKRSDSKRSIDALAASSLLRQPGVEAILDAHVEYRKAALSGQLGLSPTQVYDPNSLTWLFVDADSEQEV